MTEDREHFRTIPLEEYEQRRQKVDSRITQADLEDGLVAEAYSTNRYLSRRESAVNFTVRIEEVDRIRNAAFGIVTFKLMVYSGQLLKPIAGLYRYVQANPETTDSPRSRAPMEWQITQDRPIITPQHHQIYRGFLTHWADDDLSGLDAVKSTISDEQVVKIK